MAILYHGILGGFSGKVGNIVGYRYRDQYCIRQMPHKSLKLPSYKQLSQRAKFRLSTAFISPLGELLKPLPSKSKRKIPVFNSSLSSVLTEVITGTYPDYFFNYAAFKLSSGNLFNGNCHAVNLVQNSLIFSWCPNINKSHTEGSLVMLAYSPIKKQWVFDTSELSSNDGMATLSLPCSFKGGQVETYMYFIAAHGKAVSDSIYLGAVNFSDTSISESFINLN